MAEQRSHVGRSAADAAQQARGRGTCCTSEGRSYGSGGSGQTLHKAPGGARSLCNALNLTFHFCQTRGRGLNVGCETGIFRRFGAHLIGAAGCFHLLLRGYQLVVLGDGLFQIVLQPAPLCGLLVYAQRFHALLLIQQATDLCVGLLDLGVELRVFRRLGAGLSHLLQALLHFFDLVTQGRRLGLEGRHSALAAAQGSLERRAEVVYLGNERADSGLQALAARVKTLRI